MNYMQVETCSVSNGTGFRVVLWVSGCSLQCPGCQNPETWDCKAGKAFTGDTLSALLDRANHQWVSGLTISGGHPLEPYNIEEASRVIVAFKEKFPDKDVWLYTGLTLSAQDFISSQYSNVLSLCDVVVDGPFILEDRDVTLAFRGSKNQRLIDVKRTIESSEIVTLEV